MQVSRLALPDRGVFAVDGRCISIREPERARLSAAVVYLLLGCGSDLWLAALREMAVNQQLERTISSDDRFIYAAELVRVIDGDTVVLDIDLGCGMWKCGEHCRLYGVNSPEVYGEQRDAGAAAKRHLEQLLAGADLLVRTHVDKRDTFRRLLVELWVDEECINARMVNDGFAALVC